METTIITILATGVVALSVKIIFDWLKNRNNKENNIKCPLDRSNTIKAIDELAKRYEKESTQYEVGMADIKWLKDVHDVKDGDGIPLWYVPRSLVRGMDALVNSTNKQNVILEKISGLLRGNGDKLDTLIKNGKHK
jgi:hypothetical protein